MATLDRDHLSMNPPNIHSFSNMEEFSQVFHYMSSFQFVPLANLFGVGMTGYRLVISIIDLKFNRATKQLASHCGGVMSPILNVTKYKIFSGKHGKH